MTAKQRIARLLVLLMVLTFLPGQPVMAARTVDVETIQEFNDAINDLQKGDTIRLTKDITANADFPYSDFTLYDQVFKQMFSLSADCTIDLNGHQLALTLNNFLDEAEILFKLEEGVNVLIKNGNLVLKTMHPGKNEKVFWSEGTLEFKDTDVKILGFAEGITSTRPAPTIIVDSNFYGDNGYTLLFMNDGGRIENSTLEMGKGNVLLLYQYKHFDSPMTMVSGTIIGDKAIFLREPQSTEAVEDIFEEHARVEVNGVPWTGTGEISLSGIVEVNKELPKTGFALKMDPAAHMEADVTDVDNVEPGSEVKVTITNPEDQELETLTANGVDVTDLVIEGKYTFTMTNKDMELIATFALLEEKTGHTLTLDPEENIQADQTDLTDIPKDTEVTVTITPPEGKILDTLKADETDVTELIEEDTYTFEMPDNDLTITATFKDIKIGYLISIFTIDKESMRINENGIDRTELLDVAPYIRNDRTMLPVRFVGQSLNMEVFFDEDTRDVFVKDATRHVKLNLDNNIVTTSASDRPYLLDSKPEVVSGRTMLPIGEIADILGFSRTDQDNPGGYLTWDGEARTVTIMVQTSGE